MSHPVNDEILENLYEEALDELSLKEFLEIRQVLDPDPKFDIEDEDTYPDWFQHGYYEHDYFHKLDVNEEEED